VIDQLSPMHAILPIRTAAIVNGDAKDCAHSSIGHQIRCLQTETWLGLFGVYFGWRSYLTHDVEFSTHFHVAQHEKTAPDVTCRVCSMMQEVEVYATKAMTDQGKASSRRGHLEL
jgi:hypothetical protein